MDLIRRALITRNSSILNSKLVEEAYNHSLQLNKERAMSNLFPSRVITFMLYNPIATFVASHSQPMTSTHVYNAHTLALTLSIVRCFPLKCLTAKRNSLKGSLA